MLHLASRNCNWGFFFGEGRLRVLLKLGQSQNSRENSSQFNLNPRLVKNVFILWKMNDSEKIFLKIVTCIS